MPPLLQTDRVGRCFRNGAGAEIWAVRDVSLKIEPGTFVVLTGPSGSGKTTLLTLLGAMDQPTTGEVWFKGRAFGQCSNAERARLRRRFGFVFQNFSLLDGLPVWENVTYPLIPFGVSRRERQARAKELLATFNLARVGDALAAELSGGEKQRVAVARALVARPAIIFADEPTSNLDAASAANLLDCFRDLRRDGVTLVLASHDPRVSEAADAILPMEAGRPRAPAISP